MTEIKKSEFNIIPYLIIGVFVLFGAFIGQFVYRSMQNDTSLVAEDYYQKEIDFQDRLNKENSTVSIRNDIHVSYVKEELEITFPSEWKAVLGTAHLYNMSDEKQDLKLPFTTTSNTLKLKLRDIKSGNWTLKLDFSNENTAYYFEQKLNI